MFSPASGRIIIYHNSYLPDLPKCSRIVPFLKLRIKPGGLQTYNRAPQTTNLHALHLFYDIIGDLSHFITYVYIKCNQPLFYNMRDGGCSLQQLIWKSVSWRNAPSICSSITAALWVLPNLTSNWLTRLVLLGLISIEDCHIIKKNKNNLLWMDR